MEIIELLKEKAEFARDCAYFTRKMIGDDIEIDEEIEARRKEEMEEDLSDIRLSLYKFKENFFKTIGKTPFENELKDCREQAIKYLKSSYPFCFGINLYDCKMYGNLDFIGVDLTFYAICLGATDEQLQEIPTVLKSSKLKKFGDTSNYYCTRDVSEENISIDEVQGSYLEKYQGDNLFSILSLQGINDKNVERYIKYIMEKGALDNPDKKVYEGICLYKDDNGDLFVSEGNHRIMAYKVLKTIREFISGEKSDGIKINATVQRIRNLDRNEQEL